MANSLLTINMITREAVRLWKNTNAFLQNIDTQYDDSFGEIGAKIGNALRIRLPNDFTVRTGPAAQIQDTAEQSTTLTLATQKGVDVSFSSADRALSLDDYSKRILMPSINNLAGAVAADIMSGIDPGASDLVANVDGANNLLSPVASTYLQAGALLDTNSAPTAYRKVVNDPFTEARMVATLSGLFNPQSTIAKQYTSGRMYDALGYIWMKDQTVLKHTTGSLGTNTATVNGANQTGLVLVVSNVNGTLNVGDIITLAGSNGVNRITKQDTGALRQFVVTAPVAANGIQISIYPAIVPAGAGGAQTQYQTVVNSPTNGGFINPVLNASITYRKNFAFVPEAVTLATADLELPKGVHEAAREVYDGVSMRMVTAYDVKSDQLITRLDILYGYLYIRPEWICIVPDVV